MRTFLRSYGTKSLVRDASRDFLVVVLGILAALWLDSWWQDRQDRQDERQVLLGLMQEFQTNQSELGKVLVSLNGVQESVDQLLTFVGKPLSEADVESVRNYFSGVFRYRSFSPASGNLIAVLNSGQLDLIRNTELQTRLTGWSGLVLDLKEEEDTIHQLIAFDLGGRLRQIGVPLVLQEAAPSRFQINPEDYLADLETLNLLIAADIYCELTIAEASVVETAITEILQLIQGELEK